METQISIRVNGEPRTLPGTATVADLVRAVGLRPEQVAIERNRRLVPRAEHSSTRLEDGDELEVVTLVGGG